MLKKTLIALSMVLSCCLICIPAWGVEGVGLTSEEELQLAKEPPITAKDLDLFIITAPRFMESASDEETLEIAKEIGWSKVRMMAIGSKIAMAYTFLTDPQIYDFLVEAELFGKDFLPNDAEIALIKVRVAELETIFEEGEAPEVD